jgi:tetratricopeptide (TPR) repeat protein
MAVVDPYGPCPCGSGEKFKWCCQKVEAYAERAQRLHENGQIDAALAALEEGLRKQPDNSWLLVRKALILTGEGKPDEAKPILERVVALQPGHMGAHGLLVRVVIETEGPVAGAAQLQQALSAAPADRRSILALLARLLGTILSEAGYSASGIEHLKLVERLGGPPDLLDVTRQSIQAILADGSISLWMKNPYTLSTAPTDLKPRLRERFERALRWADEGMWSAAASAFETLSADGAGMESDRNLGLCRLWMADHTGASAALRRYVSQAGETDEAVDLEALSQQIQPTSRDEIVERVQLIWPVRNRETLLGALQQERTVVYSGRTHLDRDEEASPEAEMFALLDRPPLTHTSGLKVTDLPRVVGQVFVGLEIAALEAYDDEHLGPLADRFTVLAGSAIAPAHPRTKVLGEVARSLLPLVADWQLPAGLSRSEHARLSIEHRARVIVEIWPNVPQPYLGNRSPLQAALANDARVPLRAAVLRLEEVDEAHVQEASHAALRALLGMAPEPELDPYTIDIDRVHLARLRRVPAHRLSDEQLVALYNRARKMGARAASVQAARVLVERPALLANEEKLSVVTVISDLASVAASKGEFTEAFDWLKRGRQIEPAAQRAKNASAWDLCEIEVKLSYQEPEKWVPDLAIVLDRYSNDPLASETVLRHLLALGLVEMAPNPDDRESVLLDTRMLQSLLAKYGPKVTTAAGELGVSATRGGIWTPGSGVREGSGGLWTPGGEAAGSSGAGDRPKLIIPGR